MTPPMLPAAPVFWSPVSPRSALLLEGGDAVRFPDKFTTASLAPLAEGEGTEGFFTDARGHVIALVNLLRTRAGLWIDAAAGIAPRLREHLEHYHIREDVSFRDASADRAALLIGGAAATDWLTARSGAAVPRRLLGHAAGELGGAQVTLLSTDWYGSGGWLVFAPVADVARIAAWLTAEGVPQASAAAIEACRIEAGSPEPADIPVKTLPQELGRDARAICFTKGCYLGQETVARLDALGHVNRRLVGIATGTAVPPPVAAEVRLEDAAVGTVTSACLSPTLGQGLGLAIVHVRALAEAARPTVAGGAVRAVALPVAGPAAGAREEAT